MNCTSSPSSNTVDLISFSQEFGGSLVRLPDFPDLSFVSATPDSLIINCVPPHPPDKNGDGIADDVDTQPNDFCNDFSDVITSGTILSRGSFDVNVTDALSPDDGVHVTTKGTDFSTAAKIKLDCNPGIIVAGAGFDQTLSCGASAIIDVRSGPVSATFAGIKVELPTGTKVTVEEVSPGTFNVTNASTSSTSITVDGVAIAPGGRVTVTPPDSPVGGLAVDLDGGQPGLPLETDASSGVSTGVQAGVAAAMATALALGGAAWYARRRRWVR